MKNLKIILLMNIIFIVWTILWLFFAFDYNAYQDQLLNYVPHNSDYLNNSPPIQLQIKPTTKPKHVVLIGIDGLAAYALKSSYTPNISYLMHHGVYSLNAHSVKPTSSSANWASIFYGTDPIKHGNVDGNLWDLNHIVPTNINEGQISVYDYLINKGKNNFYFISDESFISDFKVKNGKTIAQTIIDANSKNHLIITNNDQDTSSSSSLLNPQQDFTFFILIALMQLVMLSDEILIHIITALLMLINILVKSLLI